jgi:signal transduction histidine kinase
MVTQVVESASGEVFFKRGPETGKIHEDDSVEFVTESGELRALFEEDRKRHEETGRVFEPGSSPVLRDRTGAIWNASASGGLSVTRGESNDIVVDFPQRGHAFGVNELMQDREGNVWVASPIHGLACVRHARVEVIDLGENANERAFSALLQDHAGAWWIANRRGGLLHWTPEESQRLEFTASRYFRPAAALFEDRDRRLWVASRDGSVFLREDGVFTPQFSRTQNPSKVRAITQDAEGRIWFGGSHGLASFSDGKIRQFGKAQGVPEADVTVLQPYPGGRIIAGTSSGRLLLGGADGFKTIAEAAVMNHQWISGILARSTKEVWVSTLGSGLFLWNGKTWRSFGANDGLPDLRLTCVVDDAGGNLWMGSLGGIVRAERRELLAAARDPEAAVHWLVLDHTDGMPSRECIGGFQPAGWRANDGMLWFPTGGGVVRVNPNLVERSKGAPSVYMQSVRANGVPYRGGAGPVKTGPGRSRLEFRFVGLNFSSPEKTTYRARLAGLDDAWRELGNQRVAAFEAVPPGRYTFEVMAVNGDGIRSSMPAQVPVIVKPRFWETGWFFVSAGALAFSVALGAGWFGARQRMKARIQALQIRGARESERSRIARDLHDDLGASLTEISILAALAAEEAGHTALRPSLDQLSNKAKYVVSSLDEIVWAVNPREDTLRSLVDYIAAFGREFLDLARIPLRVDLSTDIPDYHLTASQRHGVFLAVREALNNIVKHANATEVNLHIGISGSALAIRIDDNGHGFDIDHASVGHGLGNLGRRMQDAGGDCRIESRCGHGTTVFLTLPLNRSAKPIH